MSFSGSLPPELVSMILARTDADDYLSLLLTCKSFKAHLPRTLQDVMREKYDVGSWKYKKGTINPGLTIANMLDRKQGKPCVPLALIQLISCYALIEKEYNIKNYDDVDARLACTNCGKLRNGHQYVDDRRTLSCHRICNPCAVVKPDILLSRNSDLKVYGRSVFVCIICAETLPWKQAHVGMRLRSQIRLDRNATPGSNYCEPCAKKANKRTPRLLKELA